MDLKRECSDKSHSEQGGQHAADYHEKQKTEEKELDEDGEKEKYKSSTSDIHEVEKDGKEESFMWNLQQKDSTRLDVGVCKSAKCEECDNHMLAKSSCGGSAQKTTPRTTLRELMQFPADYDESPSRNSLMSQSKTSEHLERKEQEKLEKLEVVPKQYKMLAFFKRFKGHSWSSLFQPRGRESKKPQRNNNEGIFAKVTKLCRKNQTPASEREIKRSPGTKSSGNKERQRNVRGNGGLQPHWASSPCGCCKVCLPCRCGDEAYLPFECGNGKMDLKSSFGVEHDEEHRENELDEDGHKEGCKTSSLGTHHEVKIDVNEEALIRNLQQMDLTHVDLGVSNDDMCEEYNDHMFAKSSYGGFAQKTTSQNASALISAEYGSPNQNTAAVLMSQSKIWEYFELIEEEERLKKLEAMPKEYKW